MDKLRCYIADYEEYLFTDGEGKAVDKMLADGAAALASEEQQAEAKQDKEAESPPEPKKGTGKGPQHNAKHQAVTKKEESKKQHAGTAKGVEGAKKGDGSHKDSAGKEGAHQGTGDGVDEAVEEPTRQELMEQAAKE